MYLMPTWTGDQGSVKPMTNSFAEWLRIARERRGLTQTALGQMVNLSSSMMSQLESGKRNPSRMVIEQLSSALNLSPDEPLQLLGYSATDSPEKLEMQRLYDRLPQKMQRDALNFIRSAASLSGIALDAVDGAGEDTPKIPSVEHPATDRKEP
jgi:transcriptional regulator with XRE-family HTH domain